MQDLLSSITQASSVTQALRAAAAAGLQRIDAQMLLLHSLGQPTHDRAWLLTHDTDPLPTVSAETFAALCARRLEGEPVAYLVGHKDFYGLALQVDARVLDPRPDTEVLVDWALECLQSRLYISANAPVRAVDLGTGSGAIALAIKSHCPDAEVTAVDWSEDALTVARANGERLGLPVQWVHSHWMQALNGAFDVIASNPPYIRDDDPHLQALQHEPRCALTSGSDGLDDIRLLITQACTRLRAGGWLLIEHGWDQAEAVRHLLSAAGLDEVQSRHDLAGHARCSGGQWK